MARGLRAIPQGDTASPAGICGLLRVVRHPREGRITPTRRAWHASPDRDRRNHMSAMHASCAPPPASGGPHRTLRAPLPLRSEQAMYRLVRRGRPSGGAAEPHTQPVDQTHRRQPRRAQQKRSECARGALPPAPMLRRTTHIAAQWARARRCHKGSGAQVASRTTARRGPARLRVHIFTRP